MTSPLTCVVDASVVVKLFLIEPLSNEATNLFALLGADPAVSFHAPELLYLECANIFWKQCQRGNCTAAKARTDLAALQSLRLLRTPDADLASNALALALQHGITAYDASYVALALRQQVSLITADQRLVNRLTGTSLPINWLGSWTPPSPGP